MNYFSNAKKSTKEKRPIMCFDGEITLKRIKSAYELSAKGKKITSFGQFRRVRLVD